MPIRVTLQPLTEDDLYRILKEPATSQIVQQIALMGTEGVTLEYTDASLREIAKATYEINSQIENIGARRLHTVLEKLVEDLSYRCDEFAGQKIVIDEERVRRDLASLLTKRDLSKHIL